MRNRSYMVKKSTVVICLIVVVALVLFQVWQLFPHARKDDYLPGWEDYYASGSTLLSGECYDAAATAFKIAIEIDPSRPEAYIGAAQAYISLDDVERAKVILENGYEETLSEDIRLALEEIAKLPISSETQSDVGTE